MMMMMMMESRFLLALPLPLLLDITKQNPGEVTIQNSGR